MRIASLQPSISATLHALGRLETLCAHTRYCLESVPELAARNLPILGDSWSFDRPDTTGDHSSLDRLLAATPDVVLASVPYRLESLAAILKAGLPVLALAPHSLADIYTDIRLIASMARASPEGEALVLRMQQTVAAAAARTAHLPDRDRPLVYCEEWGKPLIHSQPWVAELVTAGGGRFLGTPGASTQPDTVAEANPDVLLFAWCGAGDRVPLARVIHQRGWHGLAAVCNGRVHCIPDQFLNTPAHTLLDGLACIAAATHPKIPQPPAASRAISGMRTLTSCLIPDSLRFRTDQPADET
jgi:iron complex transport system substrate-binding protein